VILEAQDGAGGPADRGILATDLNSDGRYRDLLYVDGGVSSSGTSGVLKMQGKEVFRHAVEKLSQTAETALEKAGLTATMSTGSCRIRPISGSSPAPPEDGRGHGPRRGDRAGPRQHLRRVHPAGAVGRGGRRPIKHRATCSWPRPSAAGWPGARSSALVAIIPPLKEWPANPCIDLRNPSRILCPQQHARDGIRWLAKLSPGWTSPKRCSAKSGSAATKARNWSSGSGNDVRRAGEGEQVKLSSFGTFSVRSKTARIGRNPKTGEEVPISPRRVLTFRPSHLMKDRVAAGNRS
jgi:integration host factor alpha subunit